MKFHMSKIIYLQCSYITVNAASGFNIYMMSLSCTSSLFKHDRKVTNCLWKRELPFDIYWGGGAEDCPRSKLCLKKLPHD